MKKSKSSIFAIFFFLLRATNAVEVVDFASGFEGWQVNIGGGSGEWTIQEQSSFASPVEVPTSADNWFAVLSPREGVTSYVNGILSKTLNISYGDVLILNCWMSENEDNSYMSLRVATILPEENELKVLATIKPHQLWKSSWTAVTVDIGIEETSEIITVMLEASQEQLSQLIALDSIEIRDFSYAYASTVWPTGKPITKNPAGWSLDWSTGWQTSRSTYWPSDETTTGKTADMTSPVSVTELTSTDSSIQTSTVTRSANTDTSTISTDSSTSGSSVTPTYSSPFTGASDTTHSRYTDTTYSDISTPTGTSTKSYTTDSSSQATDSTWFSDQTTGSTALSSQITESTSLSSQTTDFTSFSSQTTEFTSLSSQTTESTDFSSQTTGLNDLNDLSTEYTEFSSQTINFSGWSSSSALSSKIFEDYIDFTSGLSEWDPSESDTGYWKIVKQRDLKKYKVPKSRSGEVLRTYPEDGVELNVTAILSRDISGLLDATLVIKYWCAWLSGDGVELRITKVLPDGSTQLVTTIKPDGVTRKWKEETIDLQLQEQTAEKLNIEAQMLYASEIFALDSIELKGTALEDF